MIFKPSQLAPTAKESTMTPFYTTNLVVCSILWCDPVSYPSVKARTLKIQFGYFFWNSFKDYTAVKTASYIRVDLLGAAFDTSLLKS